MDFNTPINRLGTHCSKWDKIESFGVPADSGLAMWTADSDYKTAPCVIDALRVAVDHGVFGYSWEHDDYKAAIAWWMENRHGWTLDPGWILTTQALGHALSASIQVFSEPGDHVVIFTPVYHEFALKIMRNDRHVTECPMVRNGDTYDLDFEEAERRLTGKEKVLLWCSPQNPSGRVWTVDELRSVAAFAHKHGLILVSDEVHHDLVYPGANFIPMDIAAPEARPLTITLTAASKTFNIAGLRTGQMTIPDDALRQKVNKHLTALNYAPASLGVLATMAAYSPGGAEWVDAQMMHLDENRRIFDAGINAIPGVHSMCLQSTYLGWVDFEGTGMGYEEVARRIRDDAKIAVSPGPAFGEPGAHFMRINFATQTARVEDAVARLQAAFADLQ